MKTGLNMRSVKAENQSLILLLLQRYGALSRKEIAQKSSLTPAAVTIICNELIEKGKIKETGELSKNGIALSDTVLSKLYDISTVVPAIMLALMAVILLFGYNLSKKNLEEMHAKLDLKRMEDNNE